MARSELGAAGPGAGQEQGRPRACWAERRPHPPWGDAAPAPVPGCYLCGLWPSLVAHSTRPGAR
eukprot:12191036-Alexandrium_andersonii.AAC.1